MNIRRLEVRKCHHSAKQLRHKCSFQITTLHLINMEWKIGIIVRQHYVSIMCPETNKTAQLCNYIHHAE